MTGTAKPSDARELAAALRAHVDTLDHRITTDRKRMRSAAAALDHLGRELAKARLKAREMTDRAKALERQLSVAKAEARGLRKRLARVPDGVPRLDAS